MGIQITADRRICH